LNLDLIKKQSEKESFHMSLFFPLFRILSIKGMSLFVYLSVLAAGANFKKLYKLILFIVRIG